MDSNNTSNVSTSAPVAQPVTQPADDDQEPKFPVDPSPVNGTATSNGQVQQVLVHSTLLQYRSDLYIGSGRFDDEIEEFSKLPKVNTGFSNMDAHQRLYPGVYVLGALTSLGKTTFLYQMAEQIAEAGTPVIYFSYEQNGLDMYAKAMSRRIFKHSLDDDTYKIFTAVQIRDGMAKETRELAEQEGLYYCNIKGRMTVVFARGMTVEKILDYVHEFYVKYGVTPVVIVDYLQRISPSFEAKGSPRKLDGRAQIDHALAAIKDFQVMSKMIFLVISSLNRMNYLQQIDFESFKESGNIEYDADAVWGLQLQVIHNEIFDKKEQIGKKREMVNFAKSAKPRKIEFVCLKNRSGDPFYTENFDYYAQFDTYIPETDTDTIQKAADKAGGPSPDPESTFIVQSSTESATSSASNGKWSAYPEDFVKRMKLSERASRKYNRLTPEQKKQNYAIGTDVIAISDICTINRDDYGPDTTEDISPEEEHCIRNPEYCDAVKKFYADRGITCWAPDPLMYNQTHYYKVNKDGSRGELIKTVDDPAYNADVRHYLDLFDKAMDRLSLTPVGKQTKDDDQKAVEELTHIANQAAAEDAAIEEKFKKFSPEQLAAVYRIEGETISLTDEKPDIDTTGMNPPVTERISAEEDRITPDPKFAEAVKKYYTDRCISLWPPLENEYPRTVYYAVDSSGNRKGQTGTEYDDPYNTRLNTYYRLRREAIKKIKIE